MWILLIKGRRPFRNKERNQEESFEIIDFAFALLDFPVLTFLTVLLFVLRKELGTLLPNVHHCLPILR